jgi:ParB-like chromosome segregation protein Spo0J
MVVNSVDDPGLQVDSLIENLQREGLSAADRAAALTGLRAALGLHSWEEVGHRLGLSRVYIHRLLNIDKLPPTLRDDIASAQLGEKHVRALYRLRDDVEGQHALWQAITQQHLSGDAALQRGHEIAQERRLDGASLRSAGVETHSSTLTSLLDRVLTELDRASTQELRLQRTRLAALVAHIRRTGVTGIGSSDDPLTAAATDGSPQFRTSPSRHAAIAPNPPLT